MPEHPTDAHFLFTFVFKQALKSMAFKRKYKFNWLDHLYYVSKGNTACKIIMVLKIF